MITNWPRRVAGTTAGAVASAVLIFAAPAYAQSASSLAPSTISPADTAWMTVATAFVLMMTVPGLALFYAGMVRKKNVLATMAQSLATCALVSVAWFVAG